MLGRSSIEFSAYTLSTTIAEKFETIISLGYANSRMKDLFDIAFLLEKYNIPDQDLKTALIATLAKRKTELPEIPSIFTTSYATADRVQALWSGFLKRAKLETMDLATVTKTITKRLNPLYEEIYKSKAMLEE